MQQGGKRRSSAAIWAVSAVAVLLAGGLIGASLWSTRGGADDPAELVLSDADRGAVRNAIGPEDAPVKVIEYMDYL